MIEVSLQESAPLRHPWKSGIAMGRAFELMREDGRAHLAKVQRELGYRYCRFHGLFHDEMGVVSRLADGRLGYQWSQIDKLLDALLGMGLTPFLELGPMPEALASSNTRFIFWKMNVTPPRDFAEWGELVSRLARHCVERYGLPEVRRWRFEVWNEPNLSAFWSGTQEDYWRLYEAAARALKAVDSELQVGGPASAEAGWIEPFLKMVQERDLPLDFISTHAYPQNEFADYADRAASPYPTGTYFSEIVRRVAAQVEESRPGLPVYLTEWSSLDAQDRASVDWFANPTIDDLSSGACAVRNAVSLDDDVQGLFWWVASDVFEEMGMPQAPYSNTFGLLTLDGSPKPSFHAFWMLNQLRGPRLQISYASPHPGAGAVATREGDYVRILLWNHVPPGAPEVAWEDSVRSAHLEIGGVLSRITLRQDQGSAFEAWRDAGEPHNLSVVQAAALHALGTPQAEISQIQSELIPIRLRPNEVQLLEIGPPPDPKVEKGINPATGLWETEDVADALHVDDRDI